MNIGKVYDKLHRGDALTNKELAYGIEKFSLIEKELRELGPHFHLAWMRIMYDLDTMQKAQAARKER